MRKPPFRPRPTPAAAVDRHAERAVHGRRSPRPGDASPWKAEPGPFGSPGDPTAAPEIFTEGQG